MNSDAHAAERSVASSARHHNAGAGMAVMRYLVMTKPAVWGSLTLTAVIGYMTGSLLVHQLSVMRLLVVAAALAAGTSGCESLTNFIDIPVDRVMKRTASRPLPSGEIAGDNAVVMGLVLVVAAIALSSFLGAVFTVLMGLGIFDNVVVYSFLLKRRTPQNILWGGFSGAIPVAYGFLASAPAYTLVALLLFVLVFTWTPPHIWSLSVELKEDYRRAGIPMLPVVSSKNVWGTAVALFSAITIAVTLFIVIAMGITVILLPLVALDSLFVYALLKLLLTPERSAHMFFMFTNVYLFLILLLFMTGAIALRL